MLLGYGVITFGVSVFGYDQIRNYHRGQHVLFSTEHTECFGARGLGVGALAGHPCGEHFFGAQAAVGARDGCGRIAL